jgi:hypothetical protein
LPNPVEFDKFVFLVVTRYSTGDTFGHSEGNWHISGAFGTADEAYELVKHLDSDGNPQLNSWSENGAWDPKREYKPWDGYFECYENSDVHVLPLV